MTAAEEAPASIGARGRSVAELLAAPPPAPRGAAALPTGFEPLDTVLEGGLRPGDLTVVGGAPGVGKTLATLQWARSFAAAGHRVVYACYEHDETALLARLLAAEVGAAAGQRGGEDIREARAALRRVAAGTERLDDLAAESLPLRVAIEQAAAWAERLRLVAGSSLSTGLTELSALADDADALVVDYLQKVPTAGESELARHTAAVSGLKDLALRQRLAVVAVSSCDHDGLLAARTRLHHLHGAEALAYECDVAVLLNDKPRAVDAAHRDFDPVRARGFRDTVVLTVEKNRSGQADLSAEFDADFASSRLDPDGRFVAERLAD